jgi:hypothetical protein
MCKMIGKASRLSSLMAAGVVAAVMVLNVNPASALTILNDWDLNLETVNDEGVFTGLSTTTGIDEINVVGNAVVQQEVSGGSALGQPFEESGVLQWVSATPEVGGGVTFFDLGTAGALYVTFDGLTGVLNNDGSITFDAGVGLISLILDSDNDLDPTTGTTQTLATFLIADPSGGSDLDFFGGAGANATIDVTLELVSVIDDDLFLDENGNNLDVASLTLHLVNVDSLLDEDFDPNPDNTGVVDGEGTSLIFVNNAGQWNLAQQIPEPTTLGLLGAGLIGLGFCMRRKRRD